MVNRTPASSPHDDRLLLVIGTVSGTWASLRRSSGASYGGGSSSSTRVTAPLVAGAPDLRVGGKACDWIATVEPVAAVEAGRSVVERAAAAGTDGWFAANCLSAGDLRQYSPRRRSGKRHEATGSARRLVSRGARARFRPAAGR